MNTTEIYEKYHNLIFGLCLRALRNGEDAKDLEQEVLIKVYQHMDGWEPLTDMVHWIARITQNTIIDHQRREHTRWNIRNTISLDTLVYSTEGSEQVMTVSDTIIDMEMEPEGLYLQAESRQEELNALRTALMRIGEKNRRILISDIMGDYAGDRMALYNARKAFNISVKRHHQVEVAM